MTLDLENKVAVVTGGASGIGKATVELFVEQGAKVVIADLAEERGRDFASALGSSAAFYKTNVAVADEVASLVGYSVKTYGGLDILFNNAGVSGAGGSTDYLDNDLAQFEQVMTVDLLGPMLGCKYGGAYMSKNGGGSIINTASIAASFAGYGLPEYRAAKAGVVALTRSLAIELGPDGVRVNSISPGPIMTDMIAMQSEMPKEAIDKMIAASMGVMKDMQVLERIGQPDDIAQAALFLASDRSAQVTGIDLVVDGGASLGDRVNRPAMMEQAIAAALKED